MVAGTGIFGGERGERLLTILVSFTRQALEDLFERASSQQVFHSQLRYVPKWSTKLIGAEVAAISASAPDLPERLDTAYRMYTSELFPMLASSTPPVMEECLREYLKKMVRSPVLRNGSYFHDVHILGIRFSTMQAFRDALFDICMAQKAIAVDDDYDEITPDDSASNV